jgi:hypothetical protein
LMEVDRLHEVFAQCVHLGQALLIGQRASLGVAA